MTQYLALADPARVIAIARSWLGTPYHDQASLRGVGCDCLGLARGVWREVVGPEPFPIPAYSRDWGETGPREVLADGARRMMIEVPPAEADGTYLFGATLLYKINASATARMRGRLVLNGTTEIRGSLGEISATHVSLATAIWLQTMVPLTAGDTVELQGYFRVADGYFAADHTSFWGAKIG